jgi:ankyrin repeat protein
LADIDVPNKQGRTPVHEALLKGKLEMAALLETHGADMQLPDVYGTSLFFSFSSSFPWKETTLQRRSLVG